MPYNLILKLGRKKEDTERSHPIKLLVFSVLVLCLAFVLVYMLKPYLVNSVGNNNNNDNNQITEVTSSSIESSSESSEESSDLAVNH